MSLKGSIARGIATATLVVITSAAVVGTISGIHAYNNALIEKQNRNNERQWAYERTLKASDRMERLYRIQSESLDNIPYVKMESKESDRMEKLFRLQQSQSRAF